MTLEDGKLVEDKNYFKMSWHNVEVTLQFLADQLRVHLFVDNVCVDKREIHYDGVTMIPVPTLKECPKCRGILIPNDILKEVDLTCRKCRRGWKEQPDGTWHSRFTASLEVVNAEGEYIKVDGVDLT